MTHRVYLDFNFVRSFEIHVVSAMSSISYNGPENLLFNQSVTVKKKKKKMRFTIDTKSGAAQSSVCLYLFYLNVFYYPCISFSS